MCAMIPMFRTLSRLSEAGLASDRLWPWLKASNPPGSVRKHRLTMPLAPGDRPKGGEMSGVRILRPVARPPRRANFHIIAPMQADGPCIPPNRVRGLPWLSQCALFFLWSDSSRRSGKLEFRLGRADEISRDPPLKDSQPRKGGGQNQQLCFSDWPAI